MTKEITKMEMIPEIDAEIREVHTYVDAQGRQVKRLVDPDGKQPDIFIGTAYVGVNGPNGSTKVPFEFELTGTKVSECFSSFDLCATETMKMLQEKQRERNLIVPSSNIPQNGFKKI